MSSSFALVALLLLASPRDPDLVAAEQAYDQAEYRAVLPALARALSRPLEPVEKLRAYELMALIHAAFNDESRAVEAFRRALGVQPQYGPGAEASPKVRALFARAKELGPLAPPTVLSTPGASVPARPLYERWWFWTGVGVAVSAGAVGAIYAAGSRVPPGTLGTGAMR